MVPWMYSLIALSVTVSIVSLALTARALWRVRRTHRHRAYEKRLADISDELLECLDRLDKLSVVAKKKYQRDATRESRKSRSNGVPDPQEDPEGWKAAMRREYALGRRN